MVHKLVQIVMQVLSYFKIWGVITYTGMTICENHLYFKYL